MNSHLPHNTMMQFNLSLYHIYTMRKGERLQCPVGFE